MEILVNYFRESSSGYLYGVTKSLTPPIVLNILAISEAIVGFFLNLQLWIGDLFILVKTLALSNCSVILN